MYSLNSNEVIYSLEELKQDWLFKLLYKFFKRYGLWNKITENHPLSMRGGKNRVWGTMHSNNYCVSKMFSRTISCSITMCVWSDYDTLLKYDLLWLEFIKQHINVIPQDIKEYIEVSSQMPIDAYIDNQYKIYEREYIK